MDSEENVYVALDYAVAQKILPLINGYGETYAEFLQKLLLECDQNTMPRCYELIQVSLGEDYTYPIPNTLRFVATINLDHTTEILSPRLIDRAWIIKLQASDVLIDELTEVDVLDEYPLVTFECFAKLNDSEQWVSSSLEIAIVEKFNRIRTCFQEVGINFSPRIIGMIKRYSLRFLSKSHKLIKSAQ